MPCLAAALALVAPRVTIVVLVIFSDWIGRGFGGGVVLPFLGFIFFPYTTLAYALAMNAHGSVGGLYLLVVGIAVILDIGSLTGGFAQRRAPIRARM